MNPTEPIDNPEMSLKDIQDPPRTLWLSLRQIGPGLILAGSIVGTGELISTTGLGAENGYSLLWLIILSCIIKVFVQVELGRYAITHGKTTLAAMESLPGPRIGANWMSWLWLGMMLATQSQIAAMEGLVGQAAHSAFPTASDRIAIVLSMGWPALGVHVGLHPDHFWAALTALAAIVLLLSGGYKRLETITTALVAFVTLITVGCVVGLAWTEFPLDPAGIAGGFEFHLPSNGLGLALATFGITGVGASELFAYPYWCIEKGYARSVGPRSPDDAWAFRARGWMKVMQIDAWFSMVVFTLATVAFYLLGAAVLKPQGLDPKGAAMIESLSMMYVKPLGMWTREVFLLGAWAVLFKTLYVATAANSRLTADFLDLSGIWKAHSEKSRDRVIRFFCVVYPMAALLIYLMIGEPKGLVKLGGTAQALMLPLISGGILYLRQRDRDSRVAGTFFSDVLVWGAFFAITAVAAYSIFMEWIRPIPWASLIGWR